MNATPKAYYNEFDPRAAEWLRELIRRGLIADGDVDERSITNVKADDLSGYGQCHFFAGIGGWSLAMRLAGWPDSRPVWTGSCPCQPFSVAGKAGGVGDERHLWPAFHRLIAECRPAAVFGEQVASKAGRLWLTGVRAGLEGSRYAVGAANLCAAGIGAPHIRQRLYWVANAPLGGLGADGGAPGQPGHADQCGAAGGVGQPGAIGREGQQSAGAAPRTTFGACAAWRNYVWLPCRDGKARRVESGLAPLAHGVPARVVRLRGYGNAIVPPLAAEFVMAAMEAMEDHR